MRPILSFVGSFLAASTFAGDGTMLAGIGNTHNLADPVFFAAYAAIQKWHFSPYVKDGKASTSTAT